MSKKKPKPPEPPEIPEEVQEKLDQLDRAKQAREEYRLRMHAWATAKEHAKEAKDEAEAAANRMAAALDDTPLPLFDALDAAPEIPAEPSPAQHAARLPLERLELPAKIKAAIEAEGLSTIGELVDHIELYDTAATIKGIGPAAAKKIDLAIARTHQLFADEHTGADPCEQ